MTYNEGDRWNGREHRPAVNNPQHAARLRCPVCQRPAFMKPGDVKCWWCNHLESDIKWNRQWAEAERNEAADNAPARQHPEQL